ncbi:MAG: ShlB/FhaC/HecB family hemolysin secretion/activation protein [Syntrophobacteraceae bacterium]
MLPDREQSPVGGERPKVTKLIAAADGPQPFSVGPPRPFQGGTALSVFPSRVGELGRAAISGGMQKVSMLVEATRGLLSLHSTSRRLPRALILIAAAALFLCIARVEAVFAQTSGSEQVVSFEIKSYEVHGNTLLANVYIKERLAEFTGTGKTASDVERAREAIENLYHELGYPTVMVSIPEQTVEGGTVKFEAIEGKIRRVTINGNRYYTMEKIRKELPSFITGEIPYIPKLQEEIQKINSRSADLKVTPRMSPGEEVGTVDVELSVEDRFPLHANLELNNRASPNTTALRLSAMIRYDNLWQRDHSISVQYQTSPMDPDEVQVVAGSYVLPVPGRESDRIAVYGVMSDSASAFGEGFRTVGNGMVVGARYVLSLPPVKQYYHSITFGLDYKDFKDVLGFADPTTTNIDTAMTYMPLSIAYSGLLPDEWGYTQFSAGMNAAFRGLVTDKEEFESKRFKARGNYVVGTVGIERRQKLPGDASLFVKVDGQIANQPPISNEQYAAGGMDSVRGYKESEALGDNAVHTTIELSGPDLVKKFSGAEKDFKIVPYVFYDFAALKVNDPLPEQDENALVHSAGVGLRGIIRKNLEYDVGLGVPLANTSHTDKFAIGGFFKVKYSFE